ncbi:MAG: flotillin family protein [Chloroflexi bacterium]|nr:flotillin family protein [Chloroflexota bacterium]MBV9600900.1 flotillin family protein [Chloroflexota bacterium]
MDFLLGAVVFAAVVAVLVIMWIVGNLFRRVGPNRALIVYGWGGTHIVTGGGKVVWPLFQSFQELSLELMSFDVAPEQQLYTSQGVAVAVEAVSQIKVKSDPLSIRTASEQFLTKPPAEREALLRLVMEGHLRGIVGLLKVEEIVKEPEIVAGRVRDSVSDDLTKMGLEVVSFTIKKVIDENDYINNMGRPDIARVKREADIAQAEAERDTAIRRAMAMREAAVAQAAADQERVIAQTASEAKQAEASRDLEVKKAEYESSVRAQRASAEKAYDIASNQAQQKVVAEQVKVDQVQRQEQIRVQELEVQRRVLELEATVTKPADAERQRIQVMADAQRTKLATEAAGQAEATRLQGSAEAEIVRAKGQAEADAMHQRAEAYQEYSQAAVLDKLITGMPEVVRALSQSLASVDRITVVSTGDGHNAGVSQLTGEVAKMVAQVPELFETLTGQKVSDLMQRLRALDAPAAGVTRDNKTLDVPAATTPRDSTAGPTSTNGKKD